MKTYAVDFSGWCVIEANSSEEAEGLFWEMINEDRPLPENLYEIECVEEVEER